ncbi:heat shock 70 kDa protein 12A-like [Engraulis encrasicolus]|uniref:heat shock 70 kDa protein 12A-like n=1 Tax=Engraulis encrasicolus TaxID=184585 RepID=UPI002FD3AD31
MDTPTCRAFSSELQMSAVGHISHIFNRDSTNQSNYVIRMAKSLFYISIDFGTAYSGYSVKCTVPGVAGRFRGVMWGGKYGINTCKTPSCILFDEKKEFLDFGYGAKKKFLQDKTGYFFENFKMDLYKNPNIQRNLEISAVNGGTMKAITVISESLRYLKDDALQKIKNFSKAIIVQESDITWVLTVPAIWDDAAKQFMREAAKQAGLVTDAEPDKLIMALEPEAAALYCKQLPSDGFQMAGGKEARLEQKPKTQFMTVDCGGGTIDITVHEVLEGGFLKQVDQASGNGLGGQNVDKEFKSLLQGICGNECWEEYVKHHTDELQDLMYKFASAKCGEENEGFKFSCPYNLSETVKKCRKVEVKTLLQEMHGVSWKNGHIVISPERFRSFFDKSFSSTCELLNEIMRKPGLAIQYMLLVGGYALSNVLQDCVKKEFGNDCTILCPHHPQEAVMVGAAEFGSQPQIVKARICPLTYGVGVAHPFDESKHKPEKKFVAADGETYCYDLFHRLVKRGETVDFHEIRNYTFYPVRSDQTEVIFPFYSTTRENSEYVDDWGITKIDSIVLPTPITQGDRKINVEVKFGCTEITATAVNSVHTRRLTINFMRE